VWEKPHGSWYYKWIWKNYYWEWLG
jgi:hypothetical protein